MFRSDMSPDEARAELLRLKQGVWPRMLALFEELVPPSASDAPEAQCDWLEWDRTVESAPMLAYCRVRFGEVGHPLVGAVVAPCGTARFPMNQTAWEPPRPVVDNDPTPIEMFRAWAWGNAERMSLLRTHLLLRQEQLVVARRAEHARTYELVPRTLVPKLGWDRGNWVDPTTHVVFRKGGVIVRLGDPERDAQFRFSPPLVDKVRQGMGSETAHFFAEDVAMLHRIMHTHSFVSEGEGITELRARAAGR